MYKNKKGIVLFSKYILLDIYLAEMSVDYSFTITLKPHLYRHPTIEQYDKTYRETILMLRHMRYADKISLICEHTKNFNIHYHGIMSFKGFTKRDNLCKIFVDTFRNSSLIGYVSISQITDLAGWKEYISKEIETFRDCTDRPPILKDDYKVYIPMGLTNLIQAWA